MSVQYYQLNRTRLKAKALSRYHRVKHALVRKTYTSDVLRRRRYAKQRERVDSEFKLLRRLRFRLWKATHGKFSGVRELLGCSVAEFREYTESKFQPGMTWNNYGVHGWHLDHERACSTYNLMDSMQRRLCFHWSNIQPMWGRDNCSKGAR